MAVFTHGNLGVGVNMTVAGVRSLFDYDFWRVTSTQITLSDNSSNFSAFLGSGFRVTSKNGSVTDVTAGTLTGMKIVVSGQAALTVTGLKLSAPKVGDAIFALNDDAFLKLLLSGNDTVNGTSKADTLLGGDGSDVLKGAGGGDKLFGGAGADDLFGGAGADRFSFKSLSHSTLTSRDTIFDFSRAEGDKVDLSAIDANKNLDGNQSFKFIDSDSFNGKAGQLRFDKKGSDTYVYADVNGDRKADFSLHFDDALALKSTDFIL